MKYLKIMCITLALTVSANSVMAFSLNDVKKPSKISKKDCGDKKKCKRNKKYDKAIIAGVGVVALVAAMEIKHKSKQVADEEKVTKNYNKKNKNLPEYSTALNYDSNTAPEEAVKPGKQIIVTSDILVIPGTVKKIAKIEERLTIYDNVKSTLELKSLTKSVNANPHKAGQYQSEFTFTLPEGMPQGVYPVKTTLLLNGEAVKHEENKMQLVLNVGEGGLVELMRIALR